MHLRKVTLYEFVHVCAHAQTFLCLVHAGRREFVTSKRLTLLRPENQPPNLFFFFFFYFFNTHIHTDASSLGLYPAPLRGFYNSKATRTFHLEWTATRFWDKLNVAEAPQVSAPDQQLHQPQSHISCSTAATLPPYLSLRPSSRCSLTEIIEVGRWWEVNEALPTHSWPFPSPCANHRSTVFLDIFKWKPLNNLSNYSSRKALH